MNDFQTKMNPTEPSEFALQFVPHRPRLWQFVHFRMSNEIRGRVDADDIVQEIYIAAEQRFAHYETGSFPSFFLWLRLVAKQVLSNVHRTHLGTESRSVLRESKANEMCTYGNTSLYLSQRFVAHLTSPSQAALRSELIDQVREALDSMNEIDREVLALRHFEELTNQEVAIELNIAPKAASIRYMRALQRLRVILERI